MMIDITKFDLDDERMINAMIIHAKSSHLNLCQQCPLQDSEEEDEDGNYEGECTFLIANAALKIIERQQKTIEELEERIAIKDEPTRKIFHPDLLLFECEGCGNDVGGNAKYCDNCSRRFIDDEEGEIE